MAKDKESLIALFIDYDNLAIGLRESGNQPFEVRRVLERLLEKGRIIYKRAYADWYMFSDAKQPLHEHAIEMIDIPMRRHIGKNSADIRLVVDALDLCYTKDHIDTFVIGSGDSDFTPLVSKLKENEKRVIGFGLAQSTSNLLANNCDEFIFYEDLVSLAVNRPSLPVGLSKRQHDAFTMVIDAVAALLRENKDVLWGSLIKDTIRRKRPSFSESQYGYNSFSSLLEDAAKHQLIGLIKDPKSGGTPVVTGFGLANDTSSAARPASTQAAPSSGRGPSLMVKSEPAGLLPVKHDEDGEDKPSRPTRSKSSSRRRTPTGRGRKPSDKAAEKTAEASAEDTSSTRKPAESEPAAKEEVPETAAKTAAEKTAEDSTTDKKPARKTSGGRRRTTARKPKAAESKAAPDNKVEAEVSKPAPAEPDEAPEKPKRTTSSRKKPAKPAQAEAAKEPSTPSKPAETSASANGSTSTATSASAPDKTASTPEPEKKPKGQPLRSRVRRRRR